MYEPRYYREWINHERFSEFRVMVEESDLWIGVSPESYAPEMQSSVLKFEIMLRAVLQEYIFEYPEFRDSFDPIPIHDDDPEIVKGMKEAAFTAGTGPMAAVAGMVAEETGNFLIEKFNPPEFIVENGGDIFLRIIKPITLSIFSGKNKAFENIGLQLDSTTTPAGICTSSGMFGHSVSLGKADSVTVVCRSAYTADAYATGIANQVKSSRDIKPVVESSFTSEMRSLVCIKDNQIGIRGSLPVTRIK